MSLIRECPYSTQKNWKLSPTLLLCGITIFTWKFPEFTCLCPKTGQPDFAILILDYIPDNKCIELKSLKLYIWSYRNENTFHEAVTNRILDDMVGAIKPKYMRLTAKFYVRGGIFTDIVAEHRKSGWKPKPMVNLEKFEKQSNIRK